jgi:hypothetical protein
MSLALLGAAALARCTTVTPAALVDAGDPAAARRQAIHVAAAAFAANICGGFQACDVEAFVAAFQDQPTCVDRYTPWAERERFGEGSALTPEGLAACADALSFSTCDVWWAYEIERVRPPACDGLFVGTLPEGQGCLWGYQCASGSCPSTTGVCGTCSGPKAAGACDDDRICPAGQACSMGSCIPFVDRGSPCGAGVAFCHPLDVCRGGVCGSRVPEGGACDPALRDCEIAPHELFCRADMLCARRQLVAVGAPCGTLPDGTVQGCEHGAGCKPVAGDGGPLTSGVCEPSIPDGQPCPIDWLQIFNFYGGACVAPARCFSSRFANLTCEDTDPSACTQPPVPP